MSAAAPTETGPGVAPGRERRWGAVLALVAAVLLLRVADGFPLVVLPLAVLILGLSVRRGWGWLAFGAVVWGVAVLPGGGPMGAVSRGWALLLGGVFLAVTLLRPRWRVFSRALAAVAVALAVAGMWLGLSGTWPRFDWSVAEHVRSLAALSASEFFGRWPDARWAADMSAMVRLTADFQARFFPALLALQSLAALALAWWAFVRSRRGGSPRPGLRPLREFRFHDSLIWVVIAGLLLVLLPLGEGALRAGYNVLLFMAALYVIRGVAVFVFLARGAPTLASLVLGTLAALLFYPIVFTAVLLVGLGDTWLDVRGRVVAAAARV